MSKAELIEAVKAGDLEAFKSLLAGSPDLAQAHVDEMNIPVLSLAIYYSRAEMITALLEAGAEPNFWEAAALGKVDQLKQELAENPALINQRSLDGYSPVGLAAFFADADTVRYLIEQGADVNLVAENDMRVYPVNSAVANRNHERSVAILKVLIEAGADLDAAQHGGYTGLHAAALHGASDKVQLLLSGGADRDIKTDAGETASDMARKQGHMDVVALLEE
jgi:ankyrin repeat protein